VLDRVGMAKEEEVEVRRREEEGRPRLSNPPPPSSAGSVGGLLWVRPIRGGCWVARVGLWVVVFVVFVLGWVWYYCLVLSGGCYRVDGCMLVFWDGRARGVSVSSRVDRFGDWCG
jgi:hypothetical protein